MSGTLWEMPTLVFDGHNDALLRAGATELMAGRPDGHLDVPRARQGGLAGGIFAVFTPSPGTHEPTLAAGGWEDEDLPPLPDGLAAVHAPKHAGRLFHLEQLGGVRIARTAADLDRAHQDGTLAAVLHLEGAEAIDPGLEALELWYAAGLRSLGITWSRPNAFGHGVRGRFPGDPDTGPGLTPAGRALVLRCNTLGVLVDASHLNAAGFADLARTSEAPLVATHSNAHALCPVSRNLTDDQLDAIGASGGLVGITYVCPFLRDDGADDPDTPLRLIVDHARHVADRIGVDHVALGSDFDGATVPSALGDVAGLPRLLDALGEGGFSASEVERIAWGNWRRVLGATWRDSP
jgi:membrane dipeptidase